MRKTIGMFHLTKRLLKIAKTYGLLSSTVAFAALAYLVLLTYPQPLFGYSAKYEHNFHVYSREPIPAEIQQVLERAETKLQASPLYTDNFERRLFLTGGWGIYAFLTNKAYRSFGSSVPLLDNIMLTKSDIANDRMFVNRTDHDSRSLSGVIAHEVTHLLLRHRLGTLKAMMLPTWKNEGYCEYVAGESTISLEEGIKRLREDPRDDATYRYVKYHLMIKYLIEHEHMSVEQIMTSDLNEAETAAKTLAALQVLHGHGPLVVN
ncbi:MAG: hypothetical protein JO314_13975 [Acidobacteria bacterium]|nr:hypothetical protein [Acidobacteriota bacterium]